MEVCDKRHRLQPTKDEGAAEFGIKIWVLVVATCFEIRHFSHPRTQHTKTAGTSLGAGKMWIGRWQVSWSELNQSINRKIFPIKSKNEAFWKGLRVRQSFIEINQNLVSMSNMESSSNLKLFQKIHHKNFPSDWIHVSCRIVYEKYNSPDEHQMFMLWRGSVLLFPPLFNCFISFADHSCDKSHERELQSSENLSTSRPHDRYKSIRKQCDIFSRLLWS